MRCFWLLLFAFITCLKNSLAFDPFSNSVTEEICESAGAKLRSYPSTGTNDCLDQFVRMHSPSGYSINIGRQVSMVAGCDCGPDKCFDPTSKNCLIVGSEQMIQALKKLDDQDPENAKIKPSNSLYACSDNISIERREGGTLHRAFRLIQNACG
jgi:hypothetical protein